MQPFNKVNNTLSTHLVVYVPSTSNASKKISAGAFNMRVKETEKFLSSMFGGSTEVNAQGSYVGKGGKLIEEKVAKVEMFTTPSVWSAKKYQLLAWLKARKTKWLQEELAIEYEQNMYWV